MDIYGDGVNIAARIESLAEPGGVWVSANVHEQVHKKLDVTFRDMGEQTVKNLSAPIRAYCVVLDEDAGHGPDTRAKAEPALALPDKPSIAVLPFDNLSGDPEQEFFADGMAEDIITGLSRYRWFFVIARNSSFTYRCVLAILLDKLIGGGVGVDVRGHVVAPSAPTGSMQSGSSFATLFTRRLTGRAIRASEG